jgi:hypothetical protein
MIAVTFGQIAVTFGQIAVTSAHNNAGAAVTSAHQTQGVSRGWIAQTGAETPNAGRAARLSG